MKKLALFLTIIMSLVLAIALIACGGAVSPSISDITAKFDTIEAGGTIQIQRGAEFDPSKFDVTVTFEDSSTVKASYKGAENGFYVDMGTFNKDVLGVYEIKIGIGSTYLHAKTFKIEVIPAGTDVKSVEIKAGDDHVVKNYRIGESLDLGATKLTATLYDNTVVEKTFPLAAGDATVAVTGFDSSVAAENVAVTFNWGGITTFVNVNVYAPTALLVSGSGSHGQYYIGEAFDTAGYTFMLSWGGGLSSTTIAESDYSKLSFSGFDTTAVISADQTVAAQYTFGTNLTVSSATSITVTGGVSDRLESLSVSGTLTATQQFVNGTLDLSGLTFTATKLSGSSTVMDYSTNWDSIKGIAGAKELVVSYTFGGITKTVSVNVNVVPVAPASLAVKTAASVTSFKATATVSLAGLVFTLTNNDGSTEDLPFGDSRLTSSQSEEYIAAEHYTARTYTYSLVSNSAINSAVVVKIYAIQSLTINGEQPTYYIGDTNPNIAAYTYSITWYGGLGSDTVSATTISKETFVTDTAGETNLVLRYTNAENSDITVVASKAVTITARTPQSLSFVANGVAANEYYVGEEFFDRTDLTFTVDWTNSTSSQIESSAIEIVGFDSSQPTEVAFQVTFKYTANSVTVTCATTITVDRVIALQLTGLSYNDSTYTPVVQYANFPFDRTGLQFTAQYNSGKTETISNTDINLVDSFNSSMNEENITVSFAYKGVVEVNIYGIDVYRAEIVFNPDDYLKYEFLIDEGFYLFENATYKEYDGLNAEILSITISTANWVLNTDYKLTGFSTSEQKTEAIYTFTYQHAILEYPYSVFADGIKDLWFDQSTSMEAGFVTNYFAEQAFSANHLALEYYKASDSTVRYQATDSDYTLSSKFKGEHNGTEFDTYNSLAELSAHVELNNLWMINETYNTGVEVSFVDYKGNNRTTWIGLTLHKAHANVELSNIYLTSNGTHISEQATTEDGILYTFSQTDAPTVGGILRFEHMFGATGSIDSQGYVTTKLSGENVSEDGEIVWDFATTLTLTYTVICGLLSKDYTFVINPLQNYISELTIGGVAQTINGSTREVEFDVAKGTTIVVISASLTADATSAGYSIMIDNESRTTYTKTGLGEYTATVSVDVYDGPSRIQWLTISLQAYTPLNTVSINGAEAEMGGGNMLDIRLSTLMQNNALVVSLDEGFTYVLKKNNIVVNAENLSLSIGQNDFRICVTETATGEEKSYSLSVSVDTDNLYYIAPRIGSTEVYPDSRLEVNGAISLVSPELRDGVSFLIYREDKETLLTTSEFESITLSDTSENVFYFAFVRQDIKYWQRVELLAEGMQQVLETIYSSLRNEGQLTTNVIVRGISAASQAGKYIVTLPQGLVLNTSDLMLTLSASSVFSYTVDYDAETDVFLIHIRTLESMSLGSKSYATNDLVYTFKLNVMRVGTAQSNIDVSIYQEIDVSSQIDFTLLSAKAQNQTASGTNSYNLDLGLVANGEKLIIVTNDPYAYVSITGANVNSLSSTYTRRVQSETQIVYVYSFDGPEVAAASIVIKVDSSNALSSQTYNVTFRLVGARPLFTLDFGNDNVVEMTMNDVEGGGQWSMNLGSGPYGALPGVEPTIPYDGILDLTAIVGFESATQVNMLTAMVSGLATLHYGEANISDGATNIMFTLVPWTPNPDYPLTVQYFELVLGMTIEGNPISLVLRVAVAVGEVPEFQFNHPIEDASLFVNDYFRADTVGKDYMLDAVDALSFDSATSGIKLSSITAGWSAYWDVDASGTYTASDMELVAGSVQSGTLNTIAYYGASQMYSGDCYAFYFIAVKGDVTISYIVMIGISGAGGGAGGGGESGGGGAPASGKGTGIPYAGSKLPTFSLTIDGVTGTFTEEDLVEYDASTMLGQSSSPAIDISNEYSASNGQNMTVTVTSVGSNVFVGSGTSLSSGTAATTTAIGGTDYAYIVVMINKDTDTLYFLIVWSLIA